MTAAQSMRAEGLAAALEVRGVQVRFGVHCLTALIEPVDADAGTFSISDETRTAVILHIRRTDIPDGGIGVGDTMETDAQSYRVTRVMDQEPSLTVRLVCESSSK